MLRNIIVMVTNLTKSGNVSFNFILQLNKMKVCAWFTEKIDEEQTVQRIDHDASKKLLFRLDLLFGDEIH